MVNSEIVNFLSANLRRGLELEEIRQQLLARGYSDYDINEAIKISFPKEEEKKKIEFEKKSNDEFIRGWDEEKK